MKSSKIIGPGACISALVLLMAGPALAEGKGDRAQEAIAAARAKIDAANKIGATGEVPGMIAHAQAMLNTAKEDVSRGHKEAAIADANHAGELADTALGVANKRQTDAERDRRVDAEDAASSAQQSAAAANERAQDANERAESAEQAAAAAAAQARLRASTPAPAPTTTVSVENVHRVSTIPARRVRHRVVYRHRHRPAAAVSERTTTTVTTGPAQ